MACANHAVRAKIAVVDKASNISHLVRCSKSRRGIGSQAGLDNDLLEVGSVCSKLVQSEGPLTDVEEDIGLTKQV